ncbi:MAG: alpha/beta hydrolase, partial [Actinomycetota bacterium]|nr:alpha/beta hydrolase [Actinomycetota bacterium]
MTAIRKARVVRDVEVRYVERDGHHLAFEVFGSGPCDVLLMQSSSPIDLLWDLPQLASFLDALGSVARVIAFDARGLGASDPVVDTSAASIEATCDDTVAVLDAADSRRATILSLSSGSAAVMFAATYPERVRSLILAHLRTSHPELRNLSAEQRINIARWLTTTQNLRTENPRVAHDPELQRWWGRARRLLNSPEATAKSIEWAGSIDTDAAAPAVRVPTLVLHRSENRLW